MKLIVNGEPYETTQEDMNGLLRELNIVPERVAVEVNLKVIKRADFGNCGLHEGDCIEIVYFVGGGSQ